MIDVGNIEIIRPMNNRYNECYGIKTKTPQEIKDEVMELIDKMLTERSEADAGCD